MNEAKKLFYVWFLGARECRGLRGEEYVRPIVRYLKKKEEECEPPKVTLQIWPKGIKLVAESLRHLVPSHAVTYVSQGQPPEDDIVSVILLLYNPITKCPVHLHAYRCDSVETADLLRQQLQNLIDLPENQKKIRDLEDRLQSQGLYPGAREKSDSRLLKSCDTGIGGSSADLLATCNQSNSDSEAEVDRRSDHSAANERGRPSHNVNRNKVTAQSFTRSDQERIARLYDSLAAELRDKLSGVLTGKAAPLLLPPRDYDTQQPRKTSQTAATSSHVRSTTNSSQVRTLQRNVQDNGSSSGLSSGIGSDLDDPNPALADRSKNGGRDWAMLRSVSCQENQRRVNQQQVPRQRYSYHEPISNNNNINSEIRLQRDHHITLQRQSSDRRDFHRDNRRSMSDLRRQQQVDDDEGPARFTDAYTLRRREESFSSRDVIGRKNELSPTLRDVDFREDFIQRRKTDHPEGRSRVKDALSKFESSPGVASKVALAGGHADKKATSARSRSFHDEQPTWMGAATKYRRVPYQELDQRERFPGLDRDTARLEHHAAAATLVGASSPSSRHLQRHKSTEFVSSMATGYGGAGGGRTDSVPIFVEPVGKNHFRAVRQSLTIEHIHQNRR